MDIEQICIWLKSGTSLTKIAKKCGCDRSVIRRICVAHNLKVPKSNKEKLVLQQDEINKVVLLYNQNFTLKQISDVIKSNRPRVKKALQLGGIKLRKRTTIDIDETFFQQIDTQDKAYSLGFIFADGCVYESKGKLTGFRVQIKENDRAILDYIKKCLATDYSVKLVPRTDCGDQVSLCITNVILANQLVTLGCVPRKTKIVKFPNIKVCLLRHFLRGYFDGDGGIQNSHKYYVYPCVTICASYDFAKKLQEVCLDEFGAKSYLRFNRNIWKVSFNKRNAMLFMNYIYQGANFSLERKYNRFLFFKQYYENAGYGKIWRPIRQKAWNELKNIEKILKQY